MWLLAVLLMSTWAAVVSGFSRTLTVAQTGSGPAFEVVSIKPNRSGDERTSSIVLPGARYQATNVTLRMLIKTAYQIHDDQIVDAPGWIDIDRFDVVAKGTGNPITTEFVTQARLMLRPVLADRFKLSFVRQAREIPVYTLTLADSDGRTGPHLSRTDESACNGPLRAVPVAASAPEQNPPSPCDAAFSRAGHISARGRDIGTLTTQVFQWADRVVVDRTGLTGRFDWDMQWTQEALSAGGGAAPTVSLFTALREQLGLRLQAQRAPVDVLVIERAERPAPD